MRHFGASVLFSRIQHNFIVAIEDVFITVDYLNKCYVIFHLSINTAHLRKYCCIFQKMTAQHRALNHDYTQYSTYTCSTKSTMPLLSTTSVLCRSTSLPSCVHLYLAILGHGQARKSEARFDNIYSCDVVFYLLITSLPLVLPMLSNFFCANTALYYLLLVT